MEKKGEIVGEWKIYGREGIDKTRFLFFGWVREIVKG